MSVAQARVEQLVSLDYNDPLLADGAGTNNGTAGLADVPLADGQALGVQIGNRGLQFNVYWNVARDWPLTNATTVRVIVTWSERGVQRSAFLDFVKVDII